MTYKGSSSSINYCKYCDGLFGSTSRNTLADMCLMLVVVKAVDAREVAQTLSLKSLTCWMLKQTSSRWLLAGTSCRHQLGSNTNFRSRFERGRTSNTNFRSRFERGRTTKILVCLRREVGFGPIFMNSCWEDGLLHVWMYVPACGNADIEHRKE